MNSKLTVSQQEIINYLEDKDWTSPTEIGCVLRGQYSSWASPRCLKLVKLGYLKRNNKGHYKLMINIKKT